MDAASLSTNGRHASREGDSFDLTEDAVYRSLPYPFALGAIDGLSLEPSSPEAPPTAWSAPPKLSDSGRNSRGRTSGAGAAASSGELAGAPPSRMQRPPSVTAMYSLASEEGTAERAAPSEPGFELPGDVFDHILSQLTPYPDLFSIASVSRVWRQAALANYQERWVCVPAAEPGALERAVAAARPGDTLLLAPGLHVLSATLLIDQPLRFRLGGDGTAGATILARDFVGVRSRAPALFEGLCLRRTSAHASYPNSVAHCEAAMLTLRGCAVTGAADSDDADGGGRRSPSLTGPRGGGLGARRASGGGSRPGSAQRRALVAPAQAAPQTGLSVGPDAGLALLGCRVTSHRGPAVKVCRGRLVARGCELARSASGANVVVNGGTLELRDCEVHSACGDGVSLWNNPTAALTLNEIHSNSGAGVSLHSGAAAVSITRNRLHANGTAAFQFTSAHNHAWIEGNVLDEAEAGPPEPLPDYSLGSHALSAAAAAAAEAGGSGGCGPAICVPAFASHSMPALPRVGGGLGVVFIS